MLPLAWDQHDNAQRVAELGLGARVDTYRFTGAAQIQAQQGLRRAADLIERAAEGS